MKLINLILIYILSLPIYCLAGSWLPNEGEYNISFSSGVIDKGSRTAQKTRSENLVKIYDAIATLHYYKYKIFEEVRNRSSSPKLAPQALTEPYVTFLGGSKRLD